MKERTLTAALALAIIASRSPSAFAQTPHVEPALVNVTIAPGGSYNVDKTVYTPLIPPKPDIIFLADTTGSMQPAIDNVKANVSGILAIVTGEQSDAQFGVAQYRDFPSFCGSDTPFTLDQDITDDDTAVTLAVHAWAADGGCDTPEGQLNALYQLATEPAVGFRAGSTRIVVWFGDASGHDPSGGHSLTDAINALNSVNIRVIAVPVNSGGADGLDSTGQATAITTATGGTLLPDANNDDVADAILVGLTNLPISVAPQLGVCDPNLTLNFSPTTLTVTSGDTACFQETITAPSQCGVLSCEVLWTLNGEVVKDPETGEPDDNFTEVINVTVPDQTPPEIICPASMTVCNDPGKCSAAPTFAPIAGDTCSAVSTSCDPTSGSTFANQTTAVTCQAVDVAGNAASCGFSVTVSDCEAPKPACVQTTNPAGGNVPPGQNPDGFYQLLGADNCESLPVQLYVKDKSQGPCGGAFSAGPYAPGTKVKLTQSPGAAFVQPMAGVIVAHIHTKGEPVLVAVDAAGNSSCTTCLVPPPPK